MKNVRIDAVEYRVRVVYDTLQRSFAVSEGRNKGSSISGRAITDILGTAYGYQLRIEPDPRYPQDYDNFYDAITAPVPSHVVELPYGQETLVFSARIIDGTDTYHGRLAGSERWGGLTVSFEPIEPQRSVLYG